MKGLKKVFQAIVVIAVLIGGLWFIGSIKVKSRLEIARVNLEEKGIHIQGYRLSYEGFPLNYVVHFEDVTFDRVSTDAFQSYAIDKVSGAGTISKPIAIIPLLSPNKIEIKASEISANLAINDKEMGVITSGPIHGEITQDFDINILKITNLMAGTVEELPFQLNLLVNEIGLRENTIIVSNVKLDGIRGEEKFFYLGADQSQWDFDCFEWGARPTHYQTDGLELRMTVGFDVLFKANQYLGKEFAIPEGEQYELGQKASYQDVHFAFEYEDNKFDIQLDELLLDFSLLSSLQSIKELQEVFKGLQSDEIAAAMKAQLVKGDLTFPKLGEWLTKLEQEEVALLGKIGWTFDGEKSELQYQMGLKERFPVGTLNAQLDIGNLIKKIDHPQLNIVGSVINGKQTLELKDHALFYNGMSVRSFEPINWEALPLLTEEFCVSIAPKAFAPGEYQALIAEGTKE